VKNNFHFLLLLQNIVIEKLSDIGLVQNDWLVDLNARPPIFQVCVGVNLSLACVLSPVSCVCCCLFLVYLSTSYLTYVLLSVSCVCYCLFLSSAYSSLSASLSCVSYIPIVNNYIKYFICHHLRIDFLITQLKWTALHFAADKPLQYIILL
jgi:hypothetical protein